jgi:hypothetical protein
MLTTTEREILSLIDRAGGAGITTVQLADKFYANRADGGPLTARNVMFVYVHSIRKKLVGEGVKISCRDKRYFLEVV